jgi:endoglucanase
MPVFYRLIACFLVALLLPLHGFAQLAEQPELISSQLGYHSQAPKYAYITNYQQFLDKPHKLPKITLYDPKAPAILPGAFGKTVFKVTEATQVTLNPPGQLAKPALKVNFSDFTMEGDYELRIDGQPVGQPIHFSDYIFWDGMVPLLRSLYLMRSGSNVRYEGIDPIIERPASHLKDAFVDKYLASGRETLFKDAIGGWYNGGNDYAKYSTTTAYTVLLWLASHEQAPKPWKPFRLGYHFSEPNWGDVRDILHELKHGLNWLMAMQRSDGKVYHQIDGENPVGYTRPEEDFQTRTLSGLYPQDTALATAAFAIAAMAYQQSDVGYSIKCLMAAQRGWQALVKMSAQHKLALRGVDYIASSAIQHRYLAAVAMAMATGEAAYQQYASTLQPLALKGLAAGEIGTSWEKPALLASILLNTPAAIEIPAAIKPNLSGQVAAARNNLNKWHAQQHGQLYPMAEKPNAAVLAPLVTLLSQSALTKADLDLAAQSVYPLVGLNHYNKAFITGLGDNAVQQPSMLLSQTLRRPLPGLVTAGPEQNAVYQDKWGNPANHTEIALNATWAWVFHRINWGYNQLPSPKQA